MSWKEENSVKRIFNTLKRLKKHIFNEDVEALKTISESLENYKQTYVNDNKLYAKLLAFILMQNLLHYKDMKLAIKATDDILKNSLDFHLHFLGKALNENDKNNFFDSLNIKSDAEIKEHQKEIIEKLNENWSDETVKKSFYNTANSFLKDINNYK